MTDNSASGPFEHVLFVCTANRCRSPMAAALLRARLSEGSIDVSSAGIIAGGAPATIETVGALARRGIDLKDHVSTKITEERLSRADLVLCMTREQLRAVCAHAPEVASWSFTLVDFLTRSEAFGQRDRTTLLRSYAVRVAERRTRTELLGRRPGEDIEDPYGGTRRDYERTVCRLDDLVSELAGRIAGQEARESTADHSSDNRPSWRLLTG